MTQHQRLDYKEFIDLIDVPPPASSNNSCFAFSLHKAGSTLLFNMLQDVAHSAQLTYFSLEDRRFAFGYHPEQLPDDVDTVFKPQGYLYGGFRYLGGYNTAQIHDSSKILLVRNPLDILTSLYFSMTKSHVSPGGRGGLAETFTKRRQRALQLGIDESATSLSKGVFSRYMSYRDLLADDNLAIFRYEDIVYDKTAFLIAICRHYQWNIPERHIGAIATKHDQIPDSESPDQHIRQVHPGNHRKHLSPETIDVLNAEFEPILRAFGYKPGDASAYATLRDVTVPKWKPFLPDSD